MSELFGGALGRPWVIALLAAWALLLFGGFIFGATNADGSRRMPAWTRMGSSLALTALAWGAALAAGPGLGWIAVLAALGMTFGLIGDLFMAHLIPAKTPVLGGIGSFGVGHVCYIASFLLWGASFAAGGATPRLLAWAAWLLLGLAGWYWIVFRPAKPSALHWAALPYTLLLATTAGVATGLALSAAAMIPLAVGAALFLLSDLILATQLFNKAHFPLISDVVWLTYGPGQMLIVLAMAGRLLA
ncbi:MAG TPA: lysoplasmalogenase [Herpetosiphonaceae bacterium]